MTRFSTLCVTLLLCSVTLTSFAQKCKFKKDETDGFTKEHHRLAPSLRICTDPYWWLQMEQKGDKYYVTIKIRIVSNIRTTLTKGTSILTKFEDGTILELVAENDVTPSFNVEDDESFANQLTEGKKTLLITQWAVRISVAEYMIRQFSKSPIQLMRTTIGNTEYNMPNAIDRYTRKIMDMAICMLKKE
jgi:hypothetical protein